MKAIIPNMRSTNGFTRIYLHYKDFWPLLTTLLEGISRCKGKENDKNGETVIEIMEENY